MVKIKGEVVVKFHISYIIIILLFIAVLVLAKDKEVEIIQDGLFEEIYVEGKV